ncbi:MAG: hypothetical protein ABI583_10820 [Betaproteobacteria bacterium]
MPTIRDWIIIVVMVLGAIVIVVSFVLGLITGKVFAPGGLLGAVAGRPYFVTRAEAPIRFWYHVSWYGALTALICFLVAVYVLHPEKFHW